jgi:hypothetical protein
VNNGIYVSSLKYAKNFDHSAVVSGIARTYAQRGISVKCEPVIPGGKRADLAVAIDDGWTYIEVKTRTNGASNRHLSLRQELLRELLRLRAHSLKQLPRKERSLVVLATSASRDRRNAINKIALAREFSSRIFGHDSHKVMGMMIFTPFQRGGSSSGSWKYASTLIPNPNSRDDVETLGRLAHVQL